MRLRLIVKILRLSFVIERPRSTFAWTKERRILLPNFYYGIKSAIVRDALDISNMPMTQTIRKKK